ncbi:MAG: PEGA domain-containing protein [Vicinamibacteraceae bacterium]
MSREPWPRDWATSSTGSHVSKAIAPEGAPPLVGGEQAPQLVWPSHDEELGALEAFAPEASPPRASLVETSSDSPSPARLHPSTPQAGATTGPARVDSPSMPPAGSGPFGFGPAPAPTAPAGLATAAPPTGAEGRGNTRSPVGLSLSASSILGPGAPPPTEPPGRRAEPDATNAAERAPRGLRLLLLALIVAVLAQGIYIAVQLFGPSGDRATADGEIVIDSRPSGAEVVIDGRPRGKTPLSVRVWPGYHVVELRAGGVVRRQHVGVAAGQVASQYVELGAAETTSPDTPEPLATSGTLVVTSAPSGAEVVIDGQARGTTPLTLKALPPGRHTVRLSREGIEHTRDVEIAAGQTTNVTVPLAPKPPPEPKAGYVRVTSRIPVTILEDGKVLGSSDGGRLELPPGRHILTLENDTYGFRNEQMIEVAAGRGLTVAVTLPEGRLRANATPWAEVFVDGRSLGETPIGQATLPLGRYELVFRHPTLGERRVSVTVRADEPAVATVDFSR